MRKAAQQFVAAVSVDDRLADDDAEAGHSLRKPQRHAPAMQRQIGASSSIGHSSSGPLLARAVESVMRIACVDMCGFSARMDAAELAFAMRVPNNDAALIAVARSGVSRILDRPITPSSRSCKFRPLAREDWSRAKLEFVRPPFLCSAERCFFVPATTRKARRAQRLSRSATRKRRDGMSGAAGVPDGVEPGATMAQSGERSASGCVRQRLGAGRMARVAPTRIIGLARHHHLPGDARGATAASLGGLRATSDTSQGGASALPRLTCWMTEVAPHIKSDRSVSSPARVIPPCLALPPVE